MELFLIAAGAGLLGLAVSWIAFRPVAFGERGRPEADTATAPIPSPSPPRFFSDDPSDSVPSFTGAPAQARPEVPLETLLVQIESHVRLEQAAAQSFLESPNSKVLYSRTPSPLTEEKRRRL